MSDIDLTAPTSVFGAHSIECTGIEGVTCRGCRASGWMSWSAYRVHVLEQVAPLIEAAVREKVAAEIEADREAVKRRHGSEPEDVYVRGCLYGSSVAAGIAKNGPRL